MLIKSLLKKAWDTNKSKIRKILMQERHIVSQPRKTKLSTLRNLEWISKFRR